MFRKHGYKAVSALSFACIVSLGIAGPASAENDADGFVINKEITKAAPNPAAIAALPSDIKEKGYLTIGGETTLPPYLYRQDGGITGIESSFMQALGQALDLHIKLINTDFGSMVIGLTSGRLDVAMSTFSDTADREKQVTFIDYTKAGQQLIVAKGNPRKIHSVADLCGTTAGGPTGSLSLLVAQQQSEACIKEGKPAVSVKSYPTTAASALALKAGRIDTMGIDYAFAADMVRTSNDEIELTGHLFDLGYHGAAVNKSNKALAKALLLAFEGISKQGIDTQILNRYGIPQMKMDAPQVDALQNKN